MLKAKNIISILLTVTLLAGVLSLPAYPTSVAAAEIETAADGTADDLTATLLDATATGVEAAENNEATENNEAYPLIIVPGISHSRLYWHDEAQLNNVKKYPSGKKEGEDIQEGILAINIYSKKFIALCAGTVVSLLKSIVLQETDEYFGQWVEALGKELFSYFAKDEEGNFANADLRLIEFTKERSLFKTWYNEMTEEERTAAQEEHTVAVENGEVGATKAAALATIDSQLTAEYNALSATQKADYERLTGKALTYDEYKNLPTPLSEMTQEDEDWTYRMVPLQDYATVVGRDNVFFFTFSLYSTPLDSARALDEYIKKVKYVTGFDKVTLANVSLGGSVFVAYADLKTDSSSDIYDPNFTDLGKAISIVACLDGTTLIDDFYRAALYRTTDDYKTKPASENPYFQLDETLYSDFIYGLLSTEKDLFMREILPVIIVNVLRILPRDTVNALLSGLYTAAYDVLLEKNAQFWGMISKDAYKELVVDGQLLTEDDLIYEDTQRFYEAQCNLADNINAMIAKGVEVNNIAGYNLYFGDVDYTFFNIVTSADYTNGWGRTESTDGVVSVKGAGYGATSAVPGEKVSGTGKYISPDGNVDASTCLLPDNTWFFYNMHHEVAGNNASTMSLLLALGAGKRVIRTVNPDTLELTTTLVDVDIDDINSDPENFPQFNGAINNKPLRRNVMPESLDMCNAYVLYKEWIENPGSAKPERFTALQEQEDGTVIEVDSYYYSCGKSLYESAELRAELAAAINLGYSDVLQVTNAYDIEATQAKYAEAYAALVEVGIKIDPTVVNRRGEYKPKKEDSEALITTANVLQKIDGFVLDTVGAEGFSDFAKDAYYNDIRPVLIPVLEKVVKYIINDVVPAL